MLGTIYWYELRRALRSPAFYIYFAILFGMGFLFVALASGAFKGGVLDFGTGGKVMVNSPYSLNTIVDIISLFGIVIVTAIAGQATYQDVQSDSTSFFYTAPISKFDYLGGRFLAAFAQLVLIFVGIGLGAWIATHVSWPDRSHIGPNHLLAYLQPYLLIVLPNLLLDTSIFFALTLWTKRMLPSYVASVLGIVGYQVALELTSNLSYNKVAALFDPFGLNATQILTQYWTPFQRNTLLLPLTGVLLWNRLIWMAVGIVVLAIAYWRFSMSVPAQRRTRLRKVPQADNGAGLRAAPLALLTAHRDFSARATVAQLFSGIRLQFKETVRSIFFIVVVLAGVAMTLLLLLNGHSDVPVYPLTYIMLEWGRDAFGIFALAIITFYAGELVWRERDAKVDQLIDSQPVSTWVLFGSKFGALLLVQIVLVAVVFASGIVAQVSQGYYRFELGQYVHELAINRLIGFWILCSFALWIQVLINQRFLGYFVMVVYFVASLALPPLGLDDYLYRFGQTPPYTYSDLNGYGIFAAPLAWFHLYWAIAAIGLAMVTGLLWVRGTDGGWRTRLRIARVRLSTGPRVALAASAVLFVAVGSFIYYNTHVLNAYVSKYDQDEVRAQYEKLYRHYESLPEPRLTDVIARFDIVPERRAVTISGSMRLRNETRKPLDEVAVSMTVLAAHPSKTFGLQSLSFDGSTQALVSDPAHGFYLYRLARALLAGHSTILHYLAKYEHSGFPNSDPDTNFAENGTFITGAYSPRIGYWPDMQLTDDSTRRRHGLPNVYRMAPPEDAAARKNNALGPNSDWVNFHVTVSTAPDQVALFPGALARTWLQNGRRYFEYKTESPIMNFYSIVSGRYAVRRDHWKNVGLSIYYHPGHEFNLDTMMNGMKRALAFCTAEYGPYQFKELRIVEFPRYQSFAESLPATIPYSESLFINRYNRSDPQAIDEAFYVTAHEVGHQWWGHQVVTANTAGAAIIETLAQYTALRVMKRAYGVASMKNFLRHELNSYLDGRGLERNEEDPLFRVERQGYIYYSKGGQVMYTLAEYVGEKRIDTALAAFVRRYKFKGAPYPTTLELMAYLEKVTPPQYAYLYDDLFRHITIYDNRPLAATYVKRPDGKYAVTLTVQAQKYRADGKGEEHPVPVNDWMYIGVQDRDGFFLYLRNQKIASEKTTFDLVVNGVPAWAGVDPIDMLLDRNPDDNMMSVSRR